MPTALILGALSDVAKALAHEYAANGYDLYLAARNKERLGSVCSDLNIRYKTNVLPFEFDARNFDAHVSFYENLPSRRMW